LNDGNGLHDTEGKGEAEIVVLNATLADAECETENEDDRDGVILAVVTAEEEVVDEKLSE